MKKMLFKSLAMFAIIGSLSASASTPFTHDFNRLVAAFNDPIVWNTISGSIENIKVKRLPRSGTIFEVKTVGLGGGMNCLHEIEVINDSNDPMIPVWKVEEITEVNCTLP